MRYLGILVLTTVLFGCASTRMIDAQWDNGSIADLRDQTYRRSTWQTSRGEFHAQDFVIIGDSIFIDILVWREEEPPTGSRLLREGGPLGDRGYWRILVAPVEVSKISITKPSRHRGAKLGAFGGALLTGFVGSVTAYVFESGMSDCTENCTLDWRAPVGGLLVGATVGGLVGAGFGWLTGRETTIYRFGDRASLSTVPGGVGLQIPLGR